MSESDSEFSTQTRKRKIKETHIPNGLENGPVKHKKLKYHMHPKNNFHYIPYVHSLECEDLVKHMQRSI